MNSTMSLALTQATERSLAYVVVPPRPETDDEIGLAIPGARDAGEYEFARVVFGPGVLAAVVGQCLERLRLAGSVLLARRVQETEARGRLRRRSMDRLDHFTAALEMARAFLSDLPTDAEQEMGGSVCGAQWGRGFARVIHAVKKAEAAMREAARIEVESFDPEDRPHAASCQTALAAAVLS